MLRDSGYYPCTGLEDGGGVRRHDISTPRCCVLQRALLAPAYIFRSTTLASWCAAPRSRCTYLVVRYQGIRQYVITPVCIAMREISPTANLCIGTACVVISM